MTDEMIALARRALACKGWRWMPGMPMQSDPHRGIKNHGGDGPHHQTFGVNMINVFPTNSVKAFEIWFNDRGSGSSDPKVTELLDSVDEETGEPTVDGSEIIQAVIDACRRDGFEYVDDMNLYENGIIEETGAVLLADWIELAQEVYVR
jgi:hypothetical protein